MSNNLYSEIALGYMSAEAQKRIMEWERRSEVSTYARLAAGQMPEAWDDFKTKMKKLLFIDADTWKPTLLFDVKPMQGLPGKRMMQLERRQCVRFCPGAPQFFYINHVLPKTYPLSIAQGNQRGQVYFSNQVIHPCLAEKQPGSGTPMVWMGLTPLEVFTQRKGIASAKGRVVVGGLGLGWFLNQVCLKKSVTEVHVVDREEALLEWLKPVLLEKYPALHKVRSWICADVYSFMECDTAQQANTSYLLDIWSSYGSCDYKFDQWKKKLAPGQLWGWGDIAPKQSGGYRW